MASQRAALREARSRGYLRAATATFALVLVVLVVVVVVIVLVVVVVTVAVVVAIARFTRTFGEWGGNCSYY
jgi:heme/copper-type cytochrome/quinol oxidase subunit 2